MTLFIQPCIGQGFCPFAPQSYFFSPAAADAVVAGDAVGAPDGGAAAADEPVGAAAALASGAALAGGAAAAVSEGVAAAGTVGAALLAAFVVSATAAPVDCASPPWLPQPGAARDKQARSSANGVIVLLMRSPW
jgi:hypothetical protein